MIVIYGRMNELRRGRSGDEAAGSGDETRRDSRFGGVLPFTDGGGGLGDDATVSLDQRRRLAVHPARAARANVEEAEVQQVVLKPAPGPSVFPLDHGEQGKPGVAHDRDSTGPRPADGVEGLLHPEGALLVRAGR